MGLLVLVGFVGTFVIMAFELREFIRHRHTRSLTAPRFPPVSDLRGPNGGAPHAAIPVEKVYDAAA
jgi:hypothetical protein